MKHIYNRHYKKERIFLDCTDLGRFQKLLKRCSDKYGVKIDAYAIMDNHFHLLGDGGDISKFMMSLQRAYAQYFNVKYGKKGQVFEKNYKAKDVSTLEYLRNIKKYLLINPIDRALEIKVRDMIAVQWR